MDEEVVFSIECIFAVIELLLDTLCENYKTERFVSLHRNF